MSGEARASAALPIRRGTAADAAALAAFGARVFTETFGAENSADDMASYLAATYAPAIQRAELEEAGNTFLVADAGGTIAAYAFLRDAPVATGAGHEPAVEIARFYVDAAWRGSGLAAALMRAAVDEARARGAGVLWLGVWEENPRAIRFYEKCGFADVGSHDFLLGGDVQRDRVMVRPIAPEPEGR